MGKSEQKVAKVYTAASLTRDEIIDDKLDLFGEFLTFFFGYTFKYESSPYYLGVLEFLYEYYCNIITELNREHDIYSTIMKYLADLDDEEINLVKSNPLIDELYDIMVKLDQISDVRTLNHVNFYQYYDELLIDGALTKNNYRFLKYREILTEEKKLELLSIIPKK